MRRRLPWLLATATTALFCLPVEAAQLENWRFDADNNRLEFSTDVTVQPSAQMLFNPTRVVVDLPSVKLPRPKIEQTGRGVIRQIRWGQFTPETARVVVELDPGWTLDPSQVQVKGTSRTGWRLQLPEPQRQTGNSASSSGNSGSSSSAPAPLPPLAQTTPPLNPSSSLANADVLEVQATTDGLFIKTTGRVGNIKLERSRDRRSIDLSISDARLKGAIRLPSQTDLARLGIQSMGAITLPVRAGQPTTTRITLNLPSDGVDWNASRSGTSGIVLLPAAKPTPLSSGSSSSSGSSNSSSGSGSIAVNPPANSSPSTAAPSQGSASQPINVILPPGPPPNLNPPTNTSPSINRPPTSGRLLVVIDPGHGGPDPGAVGRGGLRETDINLDVSRQVSQLLERAGIQTIMTRTGEYDLDLQPRVDMAERANATIFVSIHANAISMSRPDVNGAETYYHSSGKQLADTIHRSIIRNTDSIDRGVRQARFYVLTRTSMPAVLVETGFVTGARDAANLSSPAFRSQMAAAIAQGIRDYLGR